MRNAIIARWSEIFRTCLQIWQQLLLRCKLWFWSFWRTWPYFTTSYPQTPGGLKSTWDGLTWISIRFFRRDCPLHPALRAKDSNLFLSGILLDRDPETPFLGPLRCLGTTWRDGVILFILVLNRMYDPNQTERARGQKGNGDYSAEICRGVLTSDHTRMLLAQRLYILASLALLQWCTFVYYAPPKCVSR